MEAMKGVYISPVQLISFLRPSRYLVEYPSTDTVSGESEERHQDCGSLDLAQPFYQEGIRCAGWARIWERIGIAYIEGHWTWHLAVVRETVSEEACQPVHPQRPVRALS